MTTVMATFVCVACKRGLWQRITFHGSAVKRLGPGTEAIALLTKECAPYCPSCGYQMTERGGLVPMVTIR